MGSAKEAEDFFVDAAVGAEVVAGVNGALACQVGGAATGFFDDDAEGGEVPRFGGPVERGVDGAFGDEHVLPETAEGAGIARGIGKAADAGAIFGVFAGTGASGEDHGFVKLSSVRNMDAFASAIGAFAAISPPARTECGSTGDPSDDFTLELDTE